MVAGTRKDLSTNWWEVWTTNVSTGQPSRFTGQYRATRQRKAKGRLTPSDCRPWQEENNDRKLSERLHFITKGEGLSMKQSMKVLTSQSTREWITPPWLIERARIALNGIDLDPASSSTAQKTVKANEYFTTGGLERPWCAESVFLNPPYNGSAAKWSAKMVHEFREGNFERGVLLVFAKFGYNWFNELFYSFSTCILKERVEFLLADGSTIGKAKHASALVHMGGDDFAFFNAFARYGRIIPKP
jgi:hypothetical protein